MPNPYHSVHIFGQEPYEIANPESRPSGLTRRTALLAIVGGGGMALLGAAAGVAYERGRNRPEEQGVYHGDLTVLHRMAHMRANGILSGAIRRSMTELLISPKKSGFDFEMMHREKATRGEITAAVRTQVRLSVSESRTTYTHEGNLLKSALELRFDAAGLGEALADPDPNVSIPALQRKIPTFLLNSATITDEGVSTEVQVLYDETGPSVAVGTVLPAHTHAGIVPVALSPERTYHLAQQLVLTQ